MASGFGFVRQPQAPAPDPRAVGQAMSRARAQPDALPRAPRLGQDRMALYPPASLEPGYGPDRSWLDRPAQPRLEQVAMEHGDPGEATLRREGATRTGGAGQTGTGSAPPGEPDYAVDEATPHSALNAAIGEALTRLGGGVMRAPAMSPARTAARQRQLLALGITPFEVELLARSGGV